VKNYYIIILISFLFYFSFKVSISFLKQLGLGQTKKSKKQLHNISHEKAKAQGPQKNTNWSRQKCKVQGRGPNRSGTQKENDTYTKYLTKQKPKPIQKLKLE
jgi:hypothetical protein